MLSIKTKQKQNKKNQNKTKQKHKTQSSCITYLHIFYLLLKMGFVFMGA